MSSSKIFLKKSVLKKLPLIILSVVAIAAIAVAITACTTQKTKADTQKLANQQITDYDTAEKYKADLDKNVEEVRKITDFQPDVAIVLGTGLQPFADQIEKVAEIGYWELSNFPVATNPAHEGKFIFGTVNGVKVVCMKGRVHYYEGYKMPQVVKPTRLMNLLGAKTIIITNSAGGVDTSFKPGDFMAVSDLIYSGSLPSPLLGPNVSDYGARFISTTNMYDPNLRQIILESAQKTGVTMHEGVYLQTAGPQYETPTETKLFRSQGAQAVGMSAGCEAIAAKHMGMKVANITFVSNEPSDATTVELTDEEVQATADKAAASFAKLMKDVLPKINNQQ